MFQRGSDPAGDAVQWDHQVPAGRMEDTGPRSTPHSAAAPGPAPDKSATASGRVPERAGAREGNGAAAQPQPRTMGSPAGPATEPEAATPTDAAGTARQAGGAEAVSEKTAKRLDGGWRPWAATAAARWTPPDVWADERPALEQVWAYARHGEWTTRSGVWRWTGCVYAFAVAVPVTGTAYYLAWICERPSRLLAAALLLIVFAQVPPLSWLV